MMVVVIFQGNATASGIASTLDSAIISLTTSMPQLTTTGSYGKAVL